MNDHAVHRGNVGPRAERREVEEDLEVDAADGADDGRGDGVEGLELDECGVVRECALA